MDVDRGKVYEIVAYNHRFSSPFSEPYCYYIWSRDEEDGADEDFVELYLRKLSYAAKNAELLISQAFQEYQSQMNLELPGDLWQKLVFESFVLAPEEREIGCCLSNGDLMFGHFIECRWDLDWNLISVWYC